MCPPHLKIKSAFQNFSGQNSQNIPSHESTGKQSGLLKEVQQIRLLTFAQKINPGKERYSKVDKSGKKCSLE